MERGISCPARWHHFSVRTKCLWWECWHVYHWVSKYFYQAQQCQRDSRECPLSHLCIFWSPSRLVSRHCPLWWCFVFTLSVTVLCFFSGTAQTPRSELHDKQAAEGCAFFRPVEWALHGHAQSFWICSGQCGVKSDGHTSLWKIKMLIHYLSSL